MATTFHGHHIPGTVDQYFSPVDRVHCGGISECPRCKAEYAEYRQLNESKYVQDDFYAEAKRILINYVDSNYSVGFEKPAFEVRLVWFSKVLRNWKALVITDLPDEKYYEITHNGDKNETYIDEYTKVKNTVVSG